MDPIKLKIKEGTITITDYEVIEGSFPPPPGPLDEVYLAAREPEELKQPWVVVDEYIMVPNGAGSNFNAGAPESPTVGILEYVTPIMDQGDYDLWVEVETPSFNDDSLFVALNDQVYVTINNLAHTPDKQWVKVLSRSFVTGTHVIRLKNREDGTKIYRFFLGKTGVNPA